MVYIPAGWHKDIYRTHIELWNHSNSGNHLISNFSFIIQIQWTFCLALIQIINSLPQNLITSNYNFMCKFISDPMVRNSLTILIWIWKRNEIFSMKWSPTHDITGNPWQIWSPVSIGRSHFEGEWISWNQNYQSQDCLFIYFSIKFLSS